MILDELPHAIKHGFVELDDIMQTLKNKHDMVHIIITGTNAPKEIIDVADLVTEMKMIKHPYEKGVMAQQGIEF